MVEIKTKEEILDKHTNKYMHTPVINAGVLINVKRSVGEAMEEYADQKAKQEALKFLQFYKDMEKQEGWVSFDEFWELFKFNNKIKGM